MDSTLIVVPYSYHCNLKSLRKLYSDSMIVTCCKRCQPHMQVIVGEVTPIYKFVYCARISSITWQYVDVRRTCRYLRITNVDLFTDRVKYLNSCQSNIINIAPRRVNIEMQFLPTRHLWHYKIFSEVFHSFLE